MEPLEQRVAELERKLAEYEKWIQIDQNFVRVKKPFKTEGLSVINGVHIYSGNGIPSFPAVDGSIYARLDGPSASGDDTLYVKYSGGTGGWNPLT